MPTNPLPAAGGAMSTAITDHDGTDQKEPMTAVELRDRLTDLRDKFWMIRLAAESDQFEGLTGTSLAVFMDEFMAEVEEMNRSLGVLFPPKVAPRTS